MNAIYCRGESLRDIVDWHHTGGFGMVGNGETDGFVFTDYNAVVNAFHYKALQDMIKLECALERDVDAAMFSEMVAETYRAFQSLLWDNRAEVYRDGVDTDHAAPHTNMMVLAFGLVPKGKTDRVAAFIRSRGMACSMHGELLPLMSFHESSWAWNYWKQAGTTSAYGHQ